MSPRRSSATPRLAYAAGSHGLTAMACRYAASAPSDRKVAAPWNPEERPIGHQFLQMAGHLANHKAQLFYYLKLLGKPVHTGHMYGV